MEYVLIIILILILSALSAMARKKPGSSKSRHAPPKIRMSDIRRAYKRAVNSARNQPPYPPPAQPQAAPYMPLTQVSADEDVPSEGRISSKTAAPTVAETYTGLSEEGLVKPMAVESVVPLAGIRPDVYYTNDEKPAAPVSKSSEPKAARIPLFEDQQEIVRAFIYAEILHRRAYPPRFR